MRNGQLIVFCENALPPKQHEFLMRDSMQADTDNQQRGPSFLSRRGASTGPDAAVNFKGTEAAMCVVGA